LAVIDVTQFRIPQLFCWRPAPSANGDVFPAITSVRHPVGNVTHDKSTRSVVKEGGALARASLIEKGGNGFRSLCRCGWLVASRLRGTAPITIVYQLYGER
jgi:hypothetical protein